MNIIHFFRRLLSHFTTKEPSNRLKVAVVVGHNEREPGAYAMAPLSTNEWGFNRQIAQSMQTQSGQHPELDLAVFYRCPTPGVSTAQEIDKVYTEVDAWGADISLELHFNASSNSGAAYPLILSSGSKASVAVAKPFASTFTNALGAPCKIWHHKRWERGGRSLWAGKAPALLLEPFFGTHANSASDAARRGPAGFARLYLKALTLYQKGIINV